MYERAWARLAPREEWFTLRLVVAAACGAGRPDEAIQVCARHICAAEQSRDPHAVARARGLSAVAEFCQGGSSSTVGVLREVLATPNVNLFNLEPLFRLVLRCVGAYSNSTGNARLDEAFETGVLDSPTQVGGVLANLVLAARRHTAEARSLVP